MPHTESQGAGEVADFEALKAQTTAVGKHLQDCLKGAVSFDVAHKTLSALVETMDTQSIATLATWLDNTAAQRKTFEETVATRVNKALTAPANNNPSAHANNNPSARAKTPKHRRAAQPEITIKQEAMEDMEVMYESEEEVFEM